MGTVFLAGVYGVGKSTLAQRVSEKASIPFYSAGDLISEKNGEKYGANKVVADKNRNQDILAECVSEILQRESHILLAGHFCVVNKFGCVDKLPEDIFGKLRIEKIILLEAQPEQILSHLASRDGKAYSIDLIRSLLDEERLAAKRTAYGLYCPLVIHQMTYTDIDETMLSNEL